MPRIGFLQNKVFPKFGYYPWECMHCRGITMLKMRERPQRLSAPAGIAAKRHAVQQPVQTVQQPQS
jgi:hypothetical protein